jgi:RNA polymerase sigma-70 factor (ECF subfamily)
VRDLVLRAQAGDEEAFAVLADASIARLDAVARLVIRDPERAKDAVQEALIRAWRDLRALRDPDRFDAWLRRLLVHACYDELRRTRRRPIEVELVSLDHQAIADQSAETAARDELAQAFRRLDPDQRLVLVLHYYLDLPLPDVASALGIPVGTAKSRLARALTALRSVLGAPDADLPVVLLAGEARR